MNPQVLQAPVIGGVGLLATLAFIAPGRELLGQVGHIFENRLYFHRNTSWRFMSVPGGRPIAVP
jgi:hypothetical protein